MLTRHSAPCDNSRFVGKPSFIKISEELPVIRPGMRPIAAEPATGDPDQQGVWPSSRRTSYAYSDRTAHGRSAAGRIADSWHALSYRRFP